jgi:acyl carrier protein
MSKPANEPVIQPASEPASEPAREPASPAAGKPASPPASPAAGASAAVDLSTLGDREIGETVRVIVAESLGRPVGDVPLSAVLMAELGAESLDFLDIVFRIERDFGIEITRGEMERAARGDMSPEEFAPGGVISTAGLARLRELMPEAADRIAPGLRPSTILTLFSVQTFANMVIGKRDGRSV